MDVNGRRERVKLQIYNTTDGMEHFHQDIELLYVLEGSLDVIAGEETVHLKEEDIFVINANKHHILKGSENVLFLQLSILYQVVSDVLQSSDVIRRLSDISLFVIGCWIVCLCISLCEHRIKE